MYSTTELYFSYMHICPNMPLVSVILFQCSRTACKGKMGSKYDHTCITSVLWELNMFHLAETILTLNPCRSLFSNTAFKINAVSLRPEEVPA